MAIGCLVHITSSPWPHDSALRTASVKDFSGMRIGRQCSLGSESGADGDSMASRRAITAARKGHKTPAAVDARAALPLRPSCPEAGGAGEGNAKEHPQAHGGGGADHLPHQEPPAEI